MNIMGIVALVVCFICFSFLAFLFVGFAWALDKAQREHKSIDEVLGNKDSV